MISNPTIICPNCSAKVPLNPKVLLAGKRITCSQCDTSIGLEQSGRGLVENALEKKGSVRGRGVRRN